MAKADYRAIKPAERRKMMNDLAEVFVGLKSKKQIKFLLERLLTESEKVMLARRFRIAEMLVGGLTYEQIKKKLGVGTSTIRDIDGWLTDAAYEYHLIRSYNRNKLPRRDDSKIKRKPVSAVDSLPSNLQGLIRGDSRMILIRLLLGDF